MLYDVEFGLWVCGESWLAIKDSLTQRPSSQGWAPGVLLLCCSVWVMCFVSVSFVLGKEKGGGDGDIFLFFLQFLFWLVCYAKENGSAVETVVDVCHGSELKVE